MEMLLGALVFAALLLAQAAAVAAVRTDRRRHATLTARAWRTSVAVAALLLPGNAHAQDAHDLTAVAHQFLQRHGVPCPRVLKVGSPRDLGEVATCQDGRDWALFWLEDEIAFIQPQTGDAYKWDRDVHRAHPHLYAGPAPGNESYVLLIYGP